MVLAGQQPHFGGPGDNAWYQGRAVIDEGDYRQMFAQATGETAIGESCSGYLYDPETPASIHHRMPDAKLIAVL